MADPTPTPTPTDPTPNPEPNPTPPPSSQQDPTPDKKPPWGDPENFDAEKAWELIQSLRASDRPGKVTELETSLQEAQSRHQEMLDSIAKALGLKPDDTPADPSKLAEQIAAEQAKTTAAETRAVEAERRLAVFQAAPELEGNALALLDSASFLASINEIDPTDAEKLGAAITAAIEKNPLFKANPAAPTPPFPGGPRPSAPTRAGSLEEAINARVASSTHR